MAIQHPQGYDDDFLNAIKTLIDHVNVHGKTIQDLVAEGQLTPEQFAELYNIVNAPQEVADEWYDKFQTKYNNLETQYATSLTDLSNDVDGVEVTASKMMYTQYDDILPDRLLSSFPFDLDLDASGNFTHDFVPDEISKNPDIEIYVDGSLGSDNEMYGDGTQSKPYKSLTKAWSDINQTTWTKATIHATGEFRRTEILNEATIPAGKTLCIIGDGDTLFYAGDKGTDYTWTADGMAYKTSRSSALNMIDRTVPSDKHGMTPPMKKVDTIAECQSTPNSWYTDFATVWVRTHDDRTPDSEVFSILSTAAFAFVLEDDSTLYLDNFVRYGTINPNGQNGKGRVIQNNLKISSGGYNVQGDGYAGTNVKETLSFNTVVAYNRKDGLNYHYSNTSETKRAECYAFEDNCISYGNGTDAGDQASTMHEGVTILRLNGDYDSQPGSGIVDVGGPLSVNVNCKTNGGVGMGINVSGEGHELMLVNSTATTETNGQYSVRAENAKMRGNIVKGIVSVTNLEAL
ncbi:hypothetical protein [Salinicoccus roseus]|uniref:hypothetical protein n=1 Tax=Salinicoccus roseus TaxID=45670 RepID=UPI0023016946|nr:hypothetical protein [Salinicoccus roseus]